MHSVQSGDTPALFKCSKLIFHKKESSFLQVWKVGQTPFIIGFYCSFELQFFKNLLNSFKFRKISPPLVWCQSNFGTKLYLLLIILKYQTLLSANYTLVPNFIFCKLYFSTKLYLVPIIL